MSRVALVIRPCAVFILLIAALLVAGQCNCTIGGVGNYHTMTHVTATINAARSLPAPVGWNNYPHYFGNAEGLALNASCRNNMLEFPLLRSGTYAGSSGPGQERVVYHGATGAFCGCMTHNGAPNPNSFVLCR
ncbi:hypothetical protein AB1N83_011136 [Pleurotus pulmonarius]